MTKLFCLIISIAMLSSCSNNADTTLSANDTTTTTNQSIDAMGTAFNDAWNNRDSAALLGMFADDAILMGGLQDHLKGKDDLNKHWIGPNLRSSSNLTSNNIRSESSNDMAFTAGTWTLKDDKGVETRGSHDIIWRKNGNGAWKIVLIHAAPFNEMPQ